MRARPRRVGFESRFNPLVYIHFQAVCDAVAVITDEPVMQMRLIKSPSKSPTCARPEKSPTR